ncbi:TonB-dependent receptor plug domain-containing protein [Sphingomonas sp. CFBP 8760]|uniref:TonB-dependent receptor plug domain-containing protein n=1 Tax=Sphingomonas sp. CFBP 8760 TaxID=2775282 RepID=UPI00177E0E83|nr:TonB-dependent receptor [Sphingomonas sp. CFBP 8760]MBD8547984.1 TonB-dependent receptor [Sphingomonas sp. CFBP 8760]
MPASLRKSAFRAVVLAGATAVAPAAVAQSIDYQALQDAIGEPVTTSVTGKPQRASELPASTIIITQAEIARSPARDVPGLLKTYAGIDVNQWTAGQRDVAVRGGAQTYNARLLVLVDGRQVYLDHYGMTDWNLLGVQLDEIQQIELVRGPANALFGFNAASGVVNIITRRVGNSPAATATAEWGNYGIGRLAGSVMLPVTPKIGLKVAGGHASENERRIPAPLLRPPMVVDTDSGQISGEVIGSFDGLGMTVGGGHATNQQIEYLPSQLLSNQRYRNDNVHATATRDTGWGGITLNGYVNWLDVRYGIGTTADAGIPVILKNRIIVTQASTLVRLGTSDTLRLGAEYRNNRLRSAQQFAERISYDVASANAMLDLHPDDRLSLTVAGRLDRLWLHQGGAIVQPAYDDPRAFDRAFTRFSFNAALLVRLDEQGSLRINGGHGYQLPSLVNFGTRLQIITPLPVPVFAVGSARIDPASMWSGEVGYVRMVGPAQLELTAFVTRTDGAIASPGDGVRTELFLTPLPSLVARFAAIGDYTTYGTELSVSGMTGGLTWRGNYTWTRTDEQLASLTIPIPYALSPRSTTPVHKANITLGYTVGRLSLSGVARYTSGTRQFAFSSASELSLYPVDDAMAVDLRAGFSLAPGIEVFGAGENMTLTGGAAVSPIPADRRIRIGLRFAI